MCVKLLILIILLMAVDGADILGLFHVPSHSHHSIGKSIFKGLAEKGHKVTMVSPFPLKTPIDNYEDIFLEEIFKIKDGPLVSSMANTNNSASEVYKIFSNFTVTMLELCLENKDFQNLLRSNRKFDLVIIDWMISDGLLGVANHFNAPIIGVNVATASFMTDKVTGNSHPYSYVPNGFIVTTDKMTFTERLQNMISTMLMEVSEKYVNEELHQKVMFKYFPQSPPVEQLQKNVSLVLINSHVLVESPRPYMANMIPIAGIHIENPKKLKPELLKFLDNAPEGFIYFSLGSTIKSSDLPDSKINHIVNAFRKLKLKVLWKFESDNIPNIPENLKISKWYSQVDILAHPNIKVFITHGGILSTIESLYFGVPMVGIPCMGDQFANTRRSVENGYAEIVSLDQINEDNLYDTITKVITNTKYSKNIKKASSIFRDHQSSPMKTAIYWIEYVLKYGGAKHLQAHSIYMKWYEYYLIDVLALLSVVIFTLVLTLIMMTKLLIKFIKFALRRPSKIVTLKKKN